MAETEAPIEQQAKRWRASMTCGDADCCYDFDYFDTRAAAEEWLAMYLQDPRVWSCTLTAPDGTFWMYEDGEWEVWD